jgi:hypothetical protein
MIDHPEDDNVTEQPATTKESAFDDLSDAMASLEFCRHSIEMYDAELSEAMTSLNRERGRLHELEKAFDEALAAYFTFVKAA